MCLHTFYTPVESVHKEFVAKKSSCGKAQEAYRVPTRTGKTGKPGKMREIFPVREKSGNFKHLPESQGTVREFCMSQGKLDQKIKKSILWGKPKISCFQTYFC